MRQFSAVLVVLGLACMAGCAPAVPEVASPVPEAASPVPVASSPPVVSPIPEGVYVGELTTTTAMMLGGTQNQSSTSTILDTVIFGPTGVPFNDQGQPIGPGDEFAFSLGDLLMWSGLRTAVQGASNGLSVVGDMTLTMNILGSPLTLFGTMTGSYTIDGSGVVTRVAHMAALGVIDDPVNFPSLTGEPVVVRLDQVGTYVKGDANPNTSGDLAPVAEAPTPSLDGTPQSAVASSQMFDGNWFFSMRGENFGFTACITVENERVVKYFDACSEPEGPVVLARPITESPDDSWLWQFTHQMNPNSPYAGTFEEWNLSVVQVTDSFYDVDAVITNTETGLDLRGPASLERR